MLSDAITWALPELRAEIESLMTSTCTISGTGASEPTTDPNTGEVIFPGGAVRYTGPCRVRPAGRVANIQQVGGAETFISDYLITLPFSATAAKGDRVTVTASPDASLVGLSMEVQEVARGDNVTARRLACTEVK